MLRFLSVRHLAVIDQLAVEFDSGFNVLTGETGAGKSVLVEAIGLLVGGRASADLVRTGETQATIQAAVTEHYRARSAFEDSIAFTVVRRQVDVRRDLASVWISVKLHHTADSTTTRDTTRAEHLLLRRTDGGWLVLSSSPVAAP